MAISRQVKCINKNDRPNRHERITHIGGDWGSNGTRIKITQAQAIKDIDNGDYAYYVKSGTKEVDVVVKNHLGHNYLTTMPDGSTNDNLLSLPECD